jgi:uncharacterized SAM-binding protein YcdF (DUF218 family)
MELAIQIAFGIVLAWLLLRFVLPIVWILLLALGAGLIALLLSPVFLTSWLDDRDARLRKQDPGYEPLLGNSGTWFVVLVAIAGLGIYVNVPH